MGHDPQIVSTWINMGNHFCSRCQVVSEICTFVMKVFNVHFLWDKGHARLSQERLNGPFKREMYLGGLSVRYIYIKYRYIYN